MLQCYIVTMLQCCISGRKKRFGRADDRTGKKVSRKKSSYPVLTARFFLRQVGHTGTVDCVVADDTASRGETFEGHRLQRIFHFVGRREDYLYPFDEVGRHLFLLFHRPALHRRAQNAHSAERNRMAVFQIRRRHLREGAENGRHVAL